MNAAPSVAPIPVTLLSGFLGAGKTTVLNYLLANPMGRRFAIVENEFGAINIDSGLISDRRGGVVELTNGCVCCTINADLVRGLQELARRRTAGELSFDWIIIETTGLADPGAVAQTFFAAPELRDTFLLDGIVVVVDALHGAGQLDTRLVAQRQAGFADRLLLAKSDLVDEGAVATLSERLSSINPRAPISVLDRGRVDPGLLLGIGGFNLDASLLAAEAADRESVRYRPLSISPSGVFHKRNNATDAIRAFVVEMGEIDLSQMSDAMQSMIDEFGDKLLRYKGILAVGGEDRRLVFQGVQRVAGFDFDALWAPDEPRVSRLVVIGENLPEASLRQRLLACAISPRNETAPACG
ncbi:CobW family GTP-binding protein [Propionivibrio soli]|uniref:CobW family GTP-binding protein n=1 Tax=Propionivibrio soli TaxID=2976531 RepID=UPI0021E82EAB|nr:GTP-binding protein [Propionivibrio soli]